MKDDPRWEFFTCQRCGQCCKELGLPYDGESARAIADFVGIPLTKLIERHYGEVVEEGKSFSLQDTKRVPCPFLRGEDECCCIVYPVRPRGCRLYPFETDFGRQGVECPAAPMAEGELHGKAGRE